MSTLWDRRSVKDLVSELKTPVDYYTGCCDSVPSSPLNILLFSRRDRGTLQQQALQNRSHHRFVLILNLETAAQVHLNHLTLPLLPGHAVLIHPYQFHHYSRVAASGLVWLFCTFTLTDGSWLEALRNRTVELGADAVRLRDSLPARWLAVGPGGGRALRGCLLQAALTQLLAALLLDSGTATLPVVEREGSLIGDVNRLLAARRDATVEVIARDLGVSASGLRSRFKGQAGVPLGAYMLNYRINRAMALLRTSRLSVAHVAEEAGFGSPQAFIRTFKQKTGQTPLVYRRRMPVSAGRSP